jgi:hypothetical protein
MVLDHYIHDITHGEPLKIWLIKIRPAFIPFTIASFPRRKSYSILLERDLIHSKNFVNLRKLLARTKKKPAIAKPVADDIPLPGDLPEGRCNYSLIIHHKSWVADKCCLFQNKTTLVAVGISP